MHKKQQEFLYIAPLNGDSTKVLDDIVNFAKDNNVKVCFNAGTSSIKKGFNYIKKILGNCTYCSRIKKKHQWLHKYKLDQIQEMKNFQMN